MNENNMNENKVNESKVNKNETCPCCGRHCDLKEPHCGRGEEYLRTGIIPERRNKEQYQEAYKAHYNLAGIEDKLIINLRDLGHFMRFQYEGKASQKRILIILSEAENITQRALTERLGIQPGSVSEIIAKLENAGLILRTQNADDRRTADIQLTDAGRALAAEAAEYHHKRHEEMFTCLSEEEKQAMLALLEKVHTDWESRFQEVRNAHRHGQCCHNHHFGKHSGCHN